MQDAPSRAHPLHVSGADKTLVAQAVPMVRGTLKHVRDGLDAAVRMIRETAQRPFEGIIEGEMVEEQEWIIFVADPRCKGAAQLHARSLDRDLWFDHFGNSSTMVHARKDDASGECITSLWQFMDVRALLCIQGFASSLSPGAVVASGRMNR